MKPGFLVFTGTAMCIAIASAILFGGQYAKPSSTLRPISLNTAETVEALDTWTPSTKGPWDGSVFMARSADGLNFSEKTLVVERAGVPNLLQLKNGDIIATYQYFSHVSENMFDVIAYSVSHDAGATWSAPVALNISGAPEVVLNSPSAGRVPMDPTLVQLEDGRLRLYFTYHPENLVQAALFSATTADENIESEFVVNEIPALAIEDRALLDPAVVFFNGVWHHYAPKDDNGIMIHSTSGDGLAFTREEDISVPMNLLGQVVVVGDELRFYGTQDGITTASSIDGYTWTIENSALAQGADPGVVILDSDEVILLYTSGI